MHELNHISHLNGNVKEIRSHLEHDQSSDTAFIKKLLPCNNISKFISYYISYFLLKFQQYAYLGQHWVF